MNTINQICAFMENRPGQLAEILSVLSENEINLRALNVAETVDYGIIRIIVDDAGKTVNKLIEAGYMISMNPVYAVAVPDRPGGLKELLDKLAADGVDIEYMYSVFSLKDMLPYMIVSAKDMKLMSDSLVKNNIDAADNKTLGIC